VRLEALMPNDQFTKTVMGLVVTLIAAGVIGIWNMSISVARMEERMQSYIDVQKATNDQVANRLEQVDVRLRMLERNNLRGHTP
jgi:hypothetical protein